MTDTKDTPSGLAAIHSEMDRQHADALATLDGVRARAAEAASALRRSGRLLLLGMGGSHAAGRAVEPLYRAMGIDAVALPISEQLDHPLPGKGRVVLVTSQSGESGEVPRWFREQVIDKGADAPEVFGLTMEGGSSLARTVPSLVGAGGTEVAFAATRSLTVTLAMHAAVLGELGMDLSEARAVLERPQSPDLTAALAATAGAATVVTSGRTLRGVAEAIALGLTELARIPAYALEGGQFRHGPLEMLGPRVGVALFRGREGTSSLVAGLGASAVEAGSPVVIFDASGEAPVVGATTVTLAPASGLAAIFTLLPAAQAFMVAFAAGRVETVGTPLRSAKVTRTE